MLCLRDPVASPDVVRKKVTVGVDHQRFGLMCVSNIQLPSLPHVSVASAATRGSASRGYRPACCENILRLPSPVGRENQSQFCGSPRIHQGR
jgi:hypothetical protein